MMASLSLDLTDILLHYILTYISGIFLDPCLLVRPSVRPRANGARRNARHEMRYGRTERRWKNNIGEKCSLSADVSARNYKEQPQQARR